MKRFALILLPIVGMLSSCEKNNDVDSITGTSGLQTAERLSDVLVGHVCTYFNESGEFVLNKENLALAFFTTWDNDAYYTSYDSGTDEWRNFYDWSRSLLGKGVFDYVDESCNNHSYVYAGISEGARIYADKVLWGRAAGEDLGDMFAIPHYHNDVIVSYPDFEVLYGHGDKLPETFREFTSESIALNSIGTSVVCLSFLEVPQEELDTVTFTIEIPVDVKYYESYPQEIYKTYNLKPEGIRLLKGSVKVKFGAYY